MSKFKTHFKGAPEASQASAMSFSGPASVRPEGAASLRGVRGSMVQFHGPTPSVPKLPASQPDLKAPGGKL